MAKIRWVVITSLIVMLMALPVFSACAEEAPPPAPTPTPAPPPAPPKILYVGGTMSLTGPYAEDSAAILAGMEDYVEWVNENKILAPWYSDKTIPENITFEVMWRDDEYNAEKILSIYDELKAKGMLVYRCSGTTTVLTLKDRLNEDRIGATSMSTTPALLSPPMTIFPNYPIYTDSLAAVADWFMENWTETRAPRVAYLTNEASFGKSILIPEMDAYLESIGYELVGTQLMPVVPTSPPTTQLLWLKENGVDLTLGVMINPGSQPTVKEMVRLDMGPHLGYKMTLACATPSHLQVFLPQLGAELAEGFVLGGGYAPWDDPGEGMTFARDLLAENRPDEVGAMHIMYVDGIIEGMTQIAALRLAMLEVPVEELTPVDVLEYGFYMIKDLSTGGVTATPLTYGPGDVEGADEVVVQQILNGEIVKMGTYPLRHLYKHE